MASIFGKNSNDTTSTESFGAWTIAKRVKLTRNIALLAIGVALFYIIFDYSYGAYEYLWYYVILLAGSTLCLTLIKYELYTLAKISLLVPGLMLLAILAAWETRETGIYMYFLVVALGAITLFGTEEKFAAIMIGLLTFVIFYIVYFTDIIDYEPLDLSEEYIKNSLLINYTICLIATMTMVYYILSISLNYERSMHETQQDLLVLTEELDKSRNKFELAIKGSSAGIWDWDIKEGKLYISPQVMRMLGYEERERTDISYEEFFSYIHPADAPLIETLLKNHLKNREKFEVECRVKNKDGEYIWVLDTGQAEWNNAGRAQRMVGSIVDITERKKAEQLVNEKNNKLRKANEELDRFVYSTSHDLRAPLSSLLGLINIAEVSDNLDEKHRCLEMMRNRVNTLNGFIADIISYSRNTRLDVKKEKVDLNQVVDEVLSGLEYFEHQKDIRIEKVFEPDLEIKCDKSRLKVILSNLISNALKYHNLDQPDPFILIKAEKFEKMVQIDVIDNGLGVDEEYLERIFDMFYRASENSDGSGLGLYIAQEMAAKLNGFITVDSKKDTGSTFRLIIPRMAKYMKEA
ncbi:PAS domain S-box protein [Fulvivirga sp. RKSG066]|uniref:sensor histidine kinase n=1 Tax=Fulvivirga aurantia TaxID=2529383 RepID=UPI0012BCAC17|nr:PAS domain-containing sensor histidine kinase [Fulvivirga aurantia]MTI23292.1 PAS domain S-box protein [Fulvivirga aurantia]